MEEENFLKELFDFTKPYLQKVDQLILNLVKSQAELIPVISEYLILLGGKRLRPIITILTAILCGYRGDRHVNLASAVEFIHTATLLHDDVVDGSCLRRGKATANDKWGNKAPILVGDFLLSQAFIIMVEDGSLEVLKILSNASKIIAEGEVMQLAATQNIDTSINEYIAIINAKTAKLFSAASEVGAVVSGVDKDKQSNLAMYGEKLGIAFQIIDDLLDYCATKQKLGKNVGDDFREGKVTLPVIFSYAKSSHQDREFWQRTIKNLDQSDKDLDYAIKLIEEQNIFEDVILMAKSYIDEARASLDVFPDSIAKKLLNDLLDFSIKRHY